jgi:hypothetical protein
MGAAVNLADFLYDAPGDASPWNCSTFPADWCVALGHPDYAAAWRDITDPVECDAAAPSGDVLVQLWGSGIGDALPVVGAPYQAGDIAVVSRAGLAAGAIYTGDMWALRRAGGVSFVTLPDSAVLKAWRP